MNNQLQPIQDKLVEVKRANGRTEYVETNELKFEQHAYPVERIEIVEEYTLETEILGREIFVAHLNIQDIIEAYSFLAKSYCRLYEDIKNLTLLDATTREIEREYLLRVTLESIKEAFPEVYWDQSISWVHPLSSAATELLKQISESIPSRYGQRNQSFIIPYRRRFN